MAIVLADIIAAYILVAPAAVATQEAFEDIAALGARPTFPVEVDADADYNNVLATQATWDTNYANAITAYNSAVTAQKLLEAAVVNLMEQNQWFKLTGLETAGLDDNWGTAGTQYVGIATNQGSNATALNIVTGTGLSVNPKLFNIWSYPTLPTQAFPNV